MPRRFRVTGALLLTLVLITAACGDKKDDDSASSTTAAGASSDLTSCQVTDTGGVDDKSFNQTAYAGAQKAEKDLGIKAKVLESTTKNDFAPNINAFLKQKCSIIVTVGFLLGDATAAAATKNPNQKFAIVDNDFFDSDANKDVSYKNVKELTFKTDEAAFLAGYVAAGTSKSGKVGTYGGLNIPTVTIFMEGFRQGVLQYDKDTGKTVKVIGWDGKDGLFTGDFEDQDKGRQTTESLLDEGADVVMPVAGPVGLGSVEAVKATSGSASLVWVDTDGCVSVPDACKYLLTSVEKKMDTAVYDVIKSVSDDSYTGGKYVGTLKNDGVGLAPYHDFDSKVPADLKAKVEDYKAKIIAGTYTIGG